MDNYLWNSKRGMYFDYDTVTQRRTTHECVTTLWPIWAGSASPSQVASLVSNALPKFEVHGGLAVSSKRSADRRPQLEPSHQWDYPYGWAPHQMLAWGGLVRYGYSDIAERLAYKWVSMILKAFVDFDGIIAEKYNVVEEHNSHKVDAEYGNQGSDFRGQGREGFGWTNASYLYGLSILSDRAKQAISRLVSYSVFKEATSSDCTLHEESEIIDSDDEDCSGTPT